MEGEKEKERGEGREREGGKERWTDRCLLGTTQKGGQAV